MRAGRVSPLFRLLHENQSQSLKGIPEQFIAKVDVLRELNYSLSSQKEL
jgi:hypothetical protein